jgi:hypothetical protein
VMPAGKRQPVCNCAWGPNAPEQRFLEETGVAFDVLMWGCAWGKPLPVEAALQKWGRALLTRKLKDNMGRQPLHVACLSMVSWTRYKGWHDTRSCV